MRTARIAPFRNRRGPARALLLPLLVLPLGCGDVGLPGPCASVPDTGAAKTCDAAVPTPSGDAPRPDPLTGLPLAGTPSVCSRVKAVTAATLDAPDASSVRLATAGSEAALIYARMPRPGTDALWSILLQRLSSSGGALGAPIELAAVYGPGKNQPPPTTIASDGASYLACWQTSTAGAASIDCALGIVGSPAMPTRTAFHAPGESPVLSYGHGSYVLRYHHRQPVVQRLSRAGVAVGDAVRFGTLDYAVSGVAAVVPTRSGFLFGARLASNGPATLQALDKELQPVGAAKPVAYDTGGLHAVDGKAALLFNQYQTDPYGYALMFASVDEEGTAGAAINAPFVRSLSLGPTVFRAAPHYSMLGLLYVQHDAAAGKQRLLFEDLGSNGGHAGPDLEVGEVAAETTYAVSLYDIAALGDGFLVAAFQRSASPHVLITKLSCVDPKSP